ncbi:DUF308 domain-containing protein [Polyangium sp. y55x31]|uniref:HdeD family acid-resistance protein n=1 Tax=Polyangium sp. y55x31 TaxID=3042688 RepID=UPI00248260F1|nr:DUF308 domain-containing protein [Polyangium sp. y55x31]MDI1478178.1 DUF308 domain-containing protein [Polyangium sp. y55x31]
MTQPPEGPVDTTRITVVGQVEDVVRKNRAWFFGLGVAFMVLGVILLLMPVIASVATAFVLGWVMVIAGIFQGFHAVRNHGWRGAGWSLVGSVLLVIAGALVAAFPLTGTLTLTLTLAAFFAANGVVKLIRAVQNRRIPAWGWLFFDGLISLALGVLIAVGWPSTAAWALGMLVGIDLLLGGTSMILIGLSAGSALRGPIATTRL